jgi:hypothetical protein
MRSSKACVTSLGVFFVLASSACNHPAPIDKDSSAKGSPITQALAGDIAGAKGPSDAAADKQGKVGAAAPADAMGSSDSPTAKDRITFMDVDFSRDRPNFIIPCIKVARSIYDKVKDGKDFVVDFNITYMSREKSVTKTVTVSVKDMKLDDPRSTDKEKFIALMADVDVSSAPPDASTTFTGTSNLLKRDLEGSSTLAATK